MKDHARTASGLRWPLILLALLVGVGLWQHRAWFSAYRHWQARQQLDAALLQAVGRERPNEVRRLLDRGASVHAVTDAGTPVAFQAWTPAVVQVFLDRGFDVNTRAAGDTLLIRAASHGNDSMVGYLLGHGADLRAQGAEALAAVRASMRAGRELLAVPPPPDSASWDEAAHVAAARKPYDRLIAVLKQAGARDGR